MRDHRSTRDIASIRKAFMIIPVENTEGRRKEKKEKKQGEIWDASVGDIRSSRRLARSFNNGRGIKYYAGREWTRTRATSGLPDVWLVPHPRELCGYDYVERDWKEELLDGGRMTGGCRRRRQGSSVNGRGGNNWLKEGGGDVERD